MHPASVAGGTLTAVGLTGYLVGIVAPYPGRAFSVTGVMVGITLLAIGRSESDGDRGANRPERREDGRTADRGGDSS